MNAEISQLQAQLDQLISKNGRVDTFKTIKERDAFLKNV